VELEANMSNGSQKKDY